MLVDTEVISNFVLPISVTLSAFAFVAFASKVAPIWFALNITTTAVRSTEITIKAAIEGPI